MNRLADSVLAGWKVLIAKLTTVTEILHPDKPGVKLLMAVVLSVLCAVLITPGLFTRSLPASDYYLDKPAEGDIKAYRDFKIPDRESTARKRKEAAEKVPTVYDLDMGAARDTVRRVRKFFDVCRSELARIESRLQKEDTAVKSDKNSSGKVVPAQKNADSNEGTKRANATAMMPMKVVDAFMEAQPDVLSVLGVNVAEADLRALAKDGFSKRAENALVDVVARVMAEPIVAGKDFLQAEAAKGITVRKISSSGDEMGEDLVREFALLKDVAQVRNEVGEEAKKGAFKEFPRDVRETLVHLARALIKPTLALNRAETEKRKEAAAEAVKPTVIFLKKGEMVVRDGEKITALKLSILRKMAEERSKLDLIQMASGSFLFIFILLIVAYRAGTAAEKSGRRIDGKDLVMMSIVLAVFLLLLKAYGLLVSPLRERFTELSSVNFFYLVPVAATAMAVRMFTSGTVTLFFSVVAGILFGIMAEGSSLMILYALVACGAGMVGSSRAARRRALITSGIRVGLVQMVLVLGFAMFESNMVTMDTAVAMLFALASGLVAGVIVTGTAPILETLFGYTTDVQLLELANLNHPLLKELIVQAPGTYHHSIIVASLVEAGAEAVGANPLLARVAAYYHDIGKIKMPMYFSENMKDGPNKHDKLAPNMSALIIMNHVKEGVELAVSYGLPGPVVDIIGEHHGQSLIKFFYQKAMEHDEAGTDEKQFRYPGPKPQTPEAALVMLADAVEATARSIADPTPARLTGLVQKTINRFFADGQLDECELTLKDLHEIARAFNRVLSGMYHHRVDYPEPATKDRRDQKKDGHAVKQEKSVGGRTDQAGESREHADGSKDSAEGKAAEVDILEEDGGEDLKRLGMS